MTSLDDRVRSTLERVADGHDSVDVETALGRVVQRGRRRRRVRYTAAGGAMVAVVAVVAAAVISRPAHHTARVASGPSSTTTSTTSVFDSPARAFCPDRYKFGYVPDGWTAQSSTVLTGPGGTAKLAAVASSTATTVVTHTPLVGLPATLRTSGGDLFELRLDAGTDPSCGGELAVITTGLDEVQRAFVANSVLPVYSLAERQMFSGVWPSSDLDRVTGLAQGDGLTDPGHAAFSFVADEMGWTSGGTLDDQPLPYYASGHELTLSNAPGGPPIARVGVIPIPGTGYWAVDYATTFLSEGDFSLGVSITESTSSPDTVNSNFGDAASAELTVSYDDQGVDLTTTTMPPQWSFELGPRPDLPGALIIRWRDAGGSVIAMHATSLHPGDFAAG